MLLAEIKNYLRTQPRVSLFELSKQFDVQGTVMRDMLNVLVRKGQIRQCTKTPRCGVKCHQCSALTIEMYEWVSSPYQQTP